MNKIEQLQSQKVSTNHLLHAILSLVFFPWIAMWIMFYLINRQTNRNIDIAIAQVDENDP